LTKRKGIVLAGGAGTRLYPATRVVSKQLLPVYDKPMVYYPISVLMLAGLREILVISAPADLPRLQALLGDGAAFGMQFSYAAQEHPEGIAQAMMIAEDFLAGAPSALILGDNLFFGHGLQARLQKASSSEQGAIIFAYTVSTPGRYGVVELAEDGTALSLEEKPAEPRSNLAVSGLYFFDAQAPSMAKTLKPSARGELEITDLNRIYLDRGALHVEQLGRGIAWFDTGTPDSLLEAAEFIATIERRQGLKIACLEEIAYRNGWIGKGDVVRLAETYGASDYAGYLKELLRSGLGER
jgi:glucose-1-phosphate thymidylyltransferase